MDIGHTLCRSGIQFDRNTRLHSSFFCGRVRIAQSLSSLSFIFFDFCMVFQLMKLASPLKRPIAVRSCPLKMRVASSLDTCQLQAFLGDPTCIPTSTWWIKWMVTLYQTYMKYIQFMCSILHRHWPEPNFGLKWIICIFSRVSVGIQTPTYWKIGGLAIN
jgi:hypothetical protein